jgi:hypothetical protein
MPSSASNAIVSIRSIARWPAATNAPFARHSAHSSSARLSATMPDPRPSVACVASAAQSSVRIATLNAASPSASIRPMLPV